MDFMFDWEAEADRFSFDDSDRFEEDSLCSWISEPESLCNNWRGWRRQNGGQLPGLSYSNRKEGDGKVTSLTELSAQAVACHLPFEVVEHFHQPVPDQLQLRIAFWSFPENEEDIRLYSCLANGSADEFQKGDGLYKNKAVKNPLQIGFHLSGMIVPPPQTLTPNKGTFNVAVVFDRRRITQCTCTCGTTSWCCHVVALCLFRIHQANQVCLRAPVSESLNRLHRDQLQKFAQYLISELPQQILPTAQRLLDELLSSQQTAINTVCGAPDPTAGPSACEQTSWCLEENMLRENIKKTLIKLCVPSPTVFSDVNYLSSTAPPAAAEWQSLLRPLRGREPEGMWNLLSIVREMYRRHDTNAIPLHEILTGEVLATEQILVWWFNTKISSFHNNPNNHSSRGNQNNNSSSQHAATSLCDEIVTLWRLAALNPSLSPIQKEDLQDQLQEWHILTIDKVRKFKSTTVNGGNAPIKKADIEMFVGFKPAMEACKLDWDDYPIPGVTYIEKHPPHWRVTLGKAHEADRRNKRSKAHQASQVSSSGMKTTDGIVQLRGHMVKTQEHRLSDLSAQTDGAYSSSSEGFCDSDRRESGARPHDSDSDLGDIDPGVASGSKMTLANVKSGHHQQHRSIHPESFDLDSDLDLPGPSGSNGAEGGGLALAPAVAHLRGDHSESQQSSDEYQMYFYDVKAAKQNDPSNDQKKKKDEINYFAGLKKMENKQEILFARAEALHAHGHMKEACKLAKQLAEEMLANPPDLTAEVPPPTSGKGKKKKNQANNASSFASTTLAKAAFLCSVLLEELECHYLAFRVGLFGVEMQRPPGGNKALDVKLAYQESELVSLLKKIPLGCQELAIIKDRAEKLKDGKLKSRGEALLPLTLASFIFDSLCLPIQTVTGSNRGACRSVQLSKGPVDEDLGFSACVEALGLKANVSEAEHPLLCEGTRRQRGELAVAMLVHYKDDQSKLSKIMDKLLDKEVHQLYKAPSMSTYLSSTTTTHPKTRHMVGGTPLQPSAVLLNPVVTQRKTPSCDSDDSMGLQDDAVKSTNSTLVAEPVNINFDANGVAHRTQGGATAAPASTSGACFDGAAAISKGLSYLNLEGGSFSNLSVDGAQGHSSGARPKTSLLNVYNNSSKDTDSSAVEDEGEQKAWEAKFRCNILKPIKKPSVGMASIDSSAPETTSSDNSPTLGRRAWGKHPGPGSDSGSSGKSSASLGSSSSGDKGATVKGRDNDSPPMVGEVRPAPPMTVYVSRSSTPNIKAGRYKGKKGIMPTVPNQPSEASAHFMNELAKTVLNKAGGNSSTSLFTQPANNNNPPAGPHRNLHLCAFQIGLYALGLHNCVSPNWLSRTYSSHVSWITGQAMEIGSAAINILIDTWEGHLTPQEVASLADRASRGRDPNMVRAAAELALSCLPHAQALNPNEIQRALIQCKEQSREMLERACVAVESAAKGGGVYPEVLFDVAKRWCELYEDSVHGHSPAVSSSANSSAARAERQQALVPVTAASVAALAANSESNSPPVIQLLPAQAVVSVPSSVNPPLIAAPTQHNQIPPGAINVQPIQYPIPPPGSGSHAQMPHHPYIAPYSYVQQVQPNFAHHYSAPHIPLHTHNIHPSYMASYPYNSPNVFTNVTPHLQNAGTMYHANVSHMRPPPPAVQVAAAAAFAANGGRNGNGQNKFVAVTAVEQQQQQQQVAAAGGQHPQQAHIVLPQGAQAGVVQHQEEPTHHPNAVHMKYLHAAYRVGMLAMETLAKRVHDDRPQTKFARNPPYGEDVKWLFSISMKLGTSYLQQFCASVVNAVVSPFVLQDIAYEAAHYLTRSNPTQVNQQLRSSTLNSLVQKCLQMFIQCTHQRMHHITQAEYDEFVSIVCHARNAFCMTAGGMVQFNELLQSLRRSKSCKKELWQRIVNGLATGTM